MGVLKSAFKPHASLSTHLPLRELRIGGASAWYHFWCTVVRVTGYSEGMVLSHPFFIKKTRPNAIVPTYKHPGDSGADLHACLDAEMVVAPGERVRVPTGISYCIPNDTEIQVRPRSGNAWKKGVTVLNSPGTCDASFRGEILVILFNASKEPFHVSPGDRIAQMVLCPVLKLPIKVVEELPESVRGDGGFGSTGV